MSFQVQTGEDQSAGGGSFLKAEGFFHMVVQKIEENVVKPSDTAFRVEATVLAGSVEGHEDELHWENFSFGTTHGDGGKFAKKRMDRMLIALGLIPPNSENQTFEIDLSEGVGRQFLCQIEPSNKEGYYQVKGANIYHLDDGDAKEYPVNEQWKEQRPPSECWEPGTAITKKPKVAVSPDEEIPF